MSEPILRIENLSLIREGRPILSNVNLEIYPGQVHALLGLNGSGKSSLAYAIMGCEGYIPDEGRILFEGRDITHLSITERARLGITLAWQEPARFEGIPVGKYVGLGVNPPNRERVIQALEAVALPAKVYGYRSADKTLSGGERKRVELAAVYAMRPRLAILDEPDSGIDILSLGEIATLIRRMAIEGVAVFLITHRDELVESADLVSLMCAGTILFSGKPLEARRYFLSRCIPHLEALGSQPWDLSKPEVREALASNGLLQLMAQPGEREDGKEQAA
ncbi:MAG: ABC transporter ATP-binding protein [Anaerolineales bacterium]|nr:ABC transporter ATP-binding protein [Anaerolineales bacterium]MDW8161874.1 ABC transporter ATP-binding protein [Anaerolineales bacterium]